MKRYSEKTFLPDAGELNHATYGEGVKYFKMGKLSNAISLFEEALEYWPLDPQAWFALGNCYDGRNNPKKAEYCFRKSLKYSPKEKLDDIYYNLANSLYDQDRLDEAIQLYLKVSEKSSAYILAQKNLALAKSEL